MALRLPDPVLLRLAGGTPLVIDGRTLEPQLQLISQVVNMSPALHTLEVTAARKLVAKQLSQLAFPKLRNVSARDTSIPGLGGHDIPVRIYRSERQDSSLPVLVYYHMGGGVVGDLDTNDGWCALLADETGCPVLSVDYRLAPEHPFPAGLEDALTAYAWALDHGDALGAPRGRAIVVGDSMGACFAAVISQHMVEHVGRRPDMQVLLYPVTDLANTYESEYSFAETFSLPLQTMNWFAQHYLPRGADRTDPRISPALAADLRQAPPTIIVTAGHDPLCDEGDQFAGRLRKAGVPITHRRHDALSHAFTAFAAVSPGSRAACLEISGWIRNALTKDASSAFARNG